MRPRRRLGAGLTLLTLFAGALGLGCGQVDDGADARRAHVRAAEAGADWLVAHAAEMPPGWAYAYLGHLIQVFPDGPRREAIASARALRVADPPAVDLERELPRDDLLSSKQLVPVLDALVVQKETGGDRALVDALRARFEAASASDFGEIPLRQQPVVLDRLRVLGIAAPIGLDDVIRSLTTRAEGRSMEALATADRYVYALTHVVLARARYYERNADPTGLEFALPVLARRIEAGLEAGSAIERDVFAFDLFAECVFSLELLGRGDGALVDAARDRIAALQAPDGSWGEGAGVTPRRIHPTLNAVMALLPLRERLAPASPTE